MQPAHAAVGVAPRLSWRPGLGLALVPVAALSIYALFLALVLHPTFQAHNVFLHAINYPFSGSLFAPWTVKGMPRRDENRVRHFRVTTADGTSIAGWHIAPERDEAGRLAARQDEVLEGDDLGQALDVDLLSKPVLLYFHGNALNRGAPIRIDAYKTFLKHNVNVVAIDYRGFGDSEGTPTERGLLEDARAACKWIFARRKAAASKQEHPSEKTSQVDDNPSYLRTSDILLAGQSLGTGVAARLALDLVDVGLPPAGVLLIAPYTSIISLLSSYRIGGFVPLFWPVRLSRRLADVADRYLLTRFESDKALFHVAKGGLRRGTQASQASVVDELDHLISLDAISDDLGLTARKNQSGAASAPSLPLITISHANDDRIIPCSHGRNLFDSVQRAYQSDGELKMEEREERQTIFSISPEENGGILTHEADWGSLLAAAPSPRAEGQRSSAPTKPIASSAFKGQRHWPLLLFKNRTGGHNSVPIHAVEYFITTALREAGNNSTLANVS